MRGGRGLANLISETWWGGRGGSHTNILSSTGVVRMSRPGSVWPVIADFEARSKHSVHRWHLLPTRIKDMEWIKTRILIHASEFKYSQFEVFPCLCREAIHMQCCPPTSYVINGEYPSRTYYVDDHYLIWSKQHCSDYDFTVWHGATIHVATL